MSEISIKESVERSFDKNNKEYVYPTGFSEIDNLTEGGFRGGLPHILAADTGMGKSTMMRNMVTRMALSKKHGGQGLNVLIISLEMSTDTLSQQILSILNDDEMRTWFRHNIKDDDLQAKREKGVELAEAIPNLKIDDSPYSTDKLCKKIKDSSGEYDVIFVDYFQHVDVGGKGEASDFNRASERITRAIKENKDVAVCLLSQITRTKGNKKTNEETYRDVQLRYAQQLSISANFELILWQEDMDDEKGDTKKRKNKMNIFLRKNRFGQKEVLMEQPMFPTKGIIGSWNKIENKDHLIHPDDENYKEKMDESFDHLFNF